MLLCWRIEHIQTPTHHAVLGLNRSPHRSCSNGVDIRARRGRFPQFEPASAPCTCESVGSTDLPLVGQLQQTTVQHSMLSAVIASASACKVPAASNPSYWRLPRPGTGVKANRFSSARCKAALQAVSISDLPNGQGGRVNIHENAFLPLNHFFLATSASWTRRGFIALAAISQTVVPGVCHRLGLGLETAGYLDQFLLFFSQGRLNQLLVNNLACGYLSSSGRVR